MDKLFHPTRYKASSYLSKLVLKLIRVNKRVLSYLWPECLNILYWKNKFQRIYNYLLQHMFFDHKPYHENNPAACCITQTVIDYAPLPIYESPSSPNICVCHCYTYMHALWVLSNGDTVAVINFRAVDVHYIWYNIVKIRSIYSFK